MAKQAVPLIKIDVYIGEVIKKKELRARIGNGSLPVCSSVSQPIIGWWDPPDGKTILMAPIFPSDVTLL